MDGACAGPAEELGPDEPMGGPMAVRSLPVQGKDDVQLL